MGGKKKLREDPELKREPVQYDPEFKGPIKNRSCTDILCFLLFVAFLAGWGVVAGFAAFNGDPSRLLYPTDSLGRVCGKDPEVVNKTYLLFFDLTRCASPKVIATGCPTPQVCVTECPKENWFYTPVADASTIRSKLICIEGVNGLTDPREPKDLVEKGICAYYYVQSKPLAGRCIPKVPGGNITMDGATILNVANETVTGKVLADASKYLAKFYQASEVAEGVFQDIKTTWWIILAGFVVAMVVSFLWIFLLRFISAVMIWFSLVAFVGLSGFGCYYTMNKYLTLRKDGAVNMTMPEFEFTTEFSKYGELETTWLVLFIITLTVFLVCFFVLIFLRKRINIAIALIGQASKAVGDIMSTLFFPIIPYIMQLIVLGFFCVVALYLSSAGKAQYRIMCPSKGCNCEAFGIKENDTCDYRTFSNTSCPEASCQFFDYYVNPNIPRLHIYNVFALFWAMFFVSAFGEMVLAGTFASWYWAFNKSKDVPSLPVTMSFGRTIRYHVGTLAFGSLIIAIVRMIRVILEYIDHKIKQKTDNKIIHCLMCCCKCCLWCLEKFLKFINRNAYVYCAIYGKNFCVSAKNAFSLIMRNIARVVVLDKVTDFLLFIGKMVVVGIVGIASFFIFSGEITTLDSYLPAMNYYLTPVIIITIGTFFIATAFFSVYAMAVDTLFLCFLEDCERNDGTSEKPYYMSKDLMKILEKKNKFKEE
ncbi:choline transporter-like protein 4 isoform X3 [Palaemon carinicauda]|uniref:choline transporter-like protein 4 isoform X3 n=1 Tax=Palaemon carinicauda TaxID=392227 RepID=UPI0035B64B7B